MVPDVPSTVGARGQSAGGGTSGAAGRLGYVALGALLGAVPLALGTGTATRLARVGIDRGA